MKLVPGDRITLGSTSYHIENRLGSGAVSDVFGALLPTTPPVRVALKFVREDAGSLEIAGLRVEGDVLTILNKAEDSSWPNPDSGTLACYRRAQETALRRHIVALIDRGEFEPGQPYLVQEFAPPAFERLEIQNLADEYKTLAVAYAVLQTIVLAHAQNMSLKDFEPDTKGNRVRVQWLDSAQTQFELKIIDWNVTGGPEDFSQDLLYFGGHLYYWLTGQTVILADSLPYNLGAEIPEWERLCEGSRQILQRLLHRDAKSRYQSAADVEADFTWWMEVIQQALLPNPHGKMQTLLVKARSQERFGRVLAVSDIALKLDPPGEIRHFLQTAAKQARDELEKEIWLPIAQARSRLLLGAYDNAAKEFLHQWNILPVGSEAARRAWFYARLAQTGGLLKKDLDNKNVSAVAGWDMLNHSIDSLIENDWKKALSQLKGFTTQLPTAAEWTPVQELLNHAQGCLIALEIALIPAPLADPEPVEELSNEVQFLKNVVNKLSQASRLATGEVNLAHQLDSRQASLDLYQDLLGRYQTVKNYEKRASKLLQGSLNSAADSLSAQQALFTSCQQADIAYQAAMRDMQDIVEKDIKPQRSRQYLERLKTLATENNLRLKNAEQTSQNLRETLQIIERVRPLLDLGLYSQALQDIRKAPDVALVHPYLVEAQTVIVPKLVKS